VTRIQPKQLEQLNPLIPKPKTLPNRFSLAFSEQLIQLKNDVSPTKTSFCAKKNPN